ncbi:uncharacterized protein LOC132316550 isoform X1 [Cornus florida]|uniref:uncharacterized protein LOC132316550 isoform X1 n=1 Tax=Cornus florida TaxID=4283 RepID=UPI00289A7914|nr:uncharacterized protein LOC132316550 isoform X1 [Cornus florida]XP_059671009.1 uncharacterized protein LOC132316550 isoform X1 [Cornus florida]
MAEIGLIGGAALGAVFGELLKLVMDVADKTKAFKSELNGLRATLNALDEIVDDIVKLDGELNVVEEKLTDLLRGGKELVLKCSKIEGSKNIMMRPRHSNELIKFTDSLLKFFQINGQALLLREIKKNRVQMNQIMAKLNELNGLESTDETEVKLDSDGCEMTVINSMKKGWETVSGNIDPNQERLSGLLLINILSGKNLAVRDKYFKKSSDPYVKVQMGEQKAVTKVVKKNVNPEWNEALTFPITDTSLPIKLKVYDKDTVTRDDKMGDADINIGPFLKAVKMQSENHQSRTTITEVKPSRDNCLDEESCIFGCDGKVVQYMLLKLQNVECGLVDLQLHWIDPLRI